MDRELSQLLEVYAGLAGGIIRDVQRQGGYVTGGYRGRAIPARLEITAIAHNHVPDQPTMRLHTHIYVGRTQPPWSTGERHPVDLGELQRRLTSRGGATSAAWSTSRHRRLGSCGRAPGSHLGR